MAIAQLDLTNRTVQPGRSSGELSSLRAPRILALGTAPGNRINPI
jgi:hypothetical protein